MQTLLHQYDVGPYVRQLQEGGSMKEFDFIRWMVELCEDGDIETAISEMKTWIGEEE